MATQYVCPGCLYQGIETQLSYSNKVFTCPVCLQSLDICTSPQQIKLLLTFSRHLKLGYRCLDCRRFLPHPWDNSQQVICPYLDCCFVGDWGHLNKMRHPSLKNTKHAHLTTVEVQPKTSVSLSTQTQKLRLIIEAHQNVLSYHRIQFTAPHKTLCYQAFHNLLLQYPTQMTDYLVDGKRAGFQHKVFQEYIRLLQAALPLTFRKYRRIQRVESLLDPSLSLFDGISTFQATVNNGVISNNTIECYIGGRKSSVVKPYYIGKLLSITDANTSQSLMDQVEEYTFHHIKVPTIASGKPVVVSHLRAPPHYQMGGMVYVNRARKQIVEEING
jgi:hypothetical protein